MSAEQTQNDWLELFFTIALLIIGVVLIGASTRIPIAEDTGLNSRSLPLAMAAAITVYGVIKTITLYGSVRGERFADIEKTGTVCRIILPLSAAMILYVVLVLALGYLISTALILVIVLWIFGVRGAPLISILEVSAAIAADVVFVRLLRIFMPDGWLIELVQEAVHA